MAQEFGILGLDWLLLNDGIDLFKKFRVAGVNGVYFLTGDIDGLEQRRMGGFGEGINASVLLEVVDGGLGVAVDDETA